MPESEIKKFFEKQTLFLTGGTGFLGKLVIEKLLRDCDLETIYVLIRPKKGKTTQERFEHFFDFPCFDRLKSERQRFQDKIHLIHGDCEEEYLGLTGEDRELLQNNVTCVIHAAANVKFNQSLSTVGKGLRALKDILDLAKKMTKLQSFVYVSTAFSNSILLHIEEKIYDPPMDPNDFLAILESNNAEQVESLTPSILEKWPNAYVYGKCLSENIIRQERGELPIAIVRPGIVANTYTEPMPGWIDNFYGVVGIVAAAGLGVLKSLHANRDTTAYMVPCDYVTNVVLAATWLVIKTKRNKEVPVYNFTGCNDNLTNWTKFQNDLESFAFDFVSNKIVWYYNFNLRDNYLWHKFCIFFFHTVPAYLIDAVLLLIGRKPMAVSNYTRLHEMLHLISFFTTRSFKFDTGNVDNLDQEMNEVDKKLFKFHMRDYDFHKAYRQAVIGGRIYLLKDPMDTLPQARRRMFVLRIVRYLTIALVCGLLYWFCKLIVNVLF